jgi:hypothetical protein
MAIWSAPVSPRTIGTEVELLRFPRRGARSTGGALGLTVPSSVLVRADEVIE